MQIVNGFLCYNCTDVARANKNIDPSHPQYGPFGVDKPKADSTSGGLSASQNTATSGFSALLPQGVGNNLDLSA